MTQNVTAGARTASVGTLAFADVAHSNSAQTPTGSMILTASDDTGSNAGWNVTIQSSAFVWAAGTGGATSGTDIPAANFSLTSAAAPASTAGQIVNATGGPLVPTAFVPATLDTALKTAQAELTYGNGTYTQALGVSLAIPAYSAAGTYTGTLTTTILSAP